jgi:hypothetical protein
MLVMALADLPNHPQIMAAIASVEARGLCTSGEAASACDGHVDANGSSHSVQYKDVLVKYGKKQLRVPYAPSLGGAAAWSSISSVFDLDPHKMKLLLRGTNLQTHTIVCL